MVRRSVWTYSFREVKELLIAWLVLGFSFSARYIRYPTFTTDFAVSLLTVGVAFVCHELAHKFVAQRYGCWAEFRYWTWGLVLALIMAFASALVGGGIIFAAPGAVHIVPIVRRVGWGFDFSVRSYGLISLMGPLVNISLAVIFLPLTGFGGVLSQLGFWGYQINLWLAMFNMLPFPPLDGYKVFMWNKVVWAVITIPLIAMIFF